MKLHLSMRSALSVCITASLLLIAATARSQERQISLDEAIAIALQGNRDIGMARIETHRADAAVSEAYGSAMPTLAASAGYTRNIQKPVFYFPMNGVVQPIKIGSDNSVNASASLSQIIFNSAVLTGMGTAKTYAALSREQLRSTAIATVLSVSRAFYGALLAREVVALNERVLQNAEQNASIARQFYQQGLRAEFDAIRAEVQAANQRPAVIQARDNYALAIEGLKNLLVIPASDEFVPVGEFLPPDTNEVEEFSVASLLPQVQRDNAMLTVARLGTDIAGDVVDIHRSEYLPTAVLFGNYQLSAQADAFRDLEMKPTSMVGVTVSLNIFNGMQSTSRVEQAQLDYEKARTQVDQLDHALRIQLESIVRRIAYARERIRSSGGTVAQGERAYQIATVAYSAGTGTQYQINDADVARAMARLNWLNAIYDYRVARAELDALLGRTVSLNTGGDDIVVTR